jgi:hypothetical protein
MSSKGGEKPPLTFSRAIGVAEVMAFGTIPVLHIFSPPQGPSAAGAQVAVIATGKHMYMNARPTIAGLKILNPKPPKTILPNIIAKTIPMTRICHGMVGGMMSA